jgi:hypothetical protein
MKALVAVLGGSAAAWALGAACGGAILLGSNDGKQPHEGGGAGSISNDDAPLPDGFETGTVAVAEAGATDKDSGPSPCLTTTFDPHNCGSCGHDCLGGACQNGTCVPLPPGVLASGQLTPSSIVVDATNVYWVNEGYASSSANGGSLFLFGVDFLNENLSARA